MMTATRLSAIALCLAPLIFTASQPNAKPAMLFDDFSYISNNQLKSHGWIIRTEPGWPGVPGATWSEKGVTLLRDPNQRTNRILRMTSATDGTTTNTTQTQICHQRKYLEGTYAARVRFSDIPVNGPAGDQLVQSFYMISPLKAPMDLDYSELDFEYLPNGGWGIAGVNALRHFLGNFQPGTKLEERQRLQNYQRQSGRLAYAGNPGS